MFDFVQVVLGTVTDISSKLHLQYPINKIRDPKTNEIKETTTSDVPDLIIVSGSLPASETSQDGATVLVRFRRGAPFPGEAPFVWTINGEKGEIRLTAEGGTTLHAQAAYSAPVVVEVHDLETNKVSRVDWQWAPWQESLPIAARSTAMLYEEFTGVGPSKYPTFEDALVRHEQLAAMLSEWSYVRKD